MGVFVCIFAGKVFNLATGGYYFRSLPLPYKLVLFLTAAALLFECYGYYLGVHLHKGNSWLFNIYILVDAWVLGVAAIYLMNVSKKYLFFAALIAHTIIWCVNVCMGSIYTFANFGLVSDFILLTAMYLTVLISNSVFKKSSILSQPVFWLSATIIFCSACAIPYFGLHHYLISNAPALASKLISINMFLDIIRYPLVAISFILLGRQKQAVLKVA